MSMCMHHVKALTINLGEGKWFHCSQNFVFFIHKSGKKNSYEKSASFLQILPISLVETGRSDYSTPPLPLKKKVNGCSLNETVA